MVNEIIAGTGVASVLVAGVAVFYSLQGLRDQLWLQMFSEYTRRYAEIVKCSCLPQPLLRGALPL